MGVDDLFYDREPQACAFPVFSSGRVDLVETVPDFGKIGFGDPAAHVFYRDKNSFVFQRRFDLDHGILRTELNSVVNKVVKHLLDLDHVCVDEKGLSCKEQFNGDPPVSAGPFKGSGSGFDHIVDIKI